MQYLGDYKENDTVQFKWNTNDRDGASITRSTDGTIYVYKDGATAESTAGITDVEDFDGVTGIHHCRIELTDAFYVTGADYQVVLKAATIDTQTVNAVLAHFSIENRFMRGTDSAALATHYTSTRAGYLDELAEANLPTDVAAIPTTAMRGTDDAATEAKQDIIDTVVDAILHMLTARWQITGNQLIIYDTDDVTPLYTFDLKNSAGDAAQIRIFDRTPA